MKMVKECIEDLRRCMTERVVKRVVIIPHISPDGDAAGACSALAEVMERLGVKWRILTCDYMPEYLRFLKHVPRLISYQDKPEDCRRLIAETDLIFMLDHNTTAREGDLEPFVREATAPRVIIDHHLEPDEEEVVISDTTVSSTCELLYTVITQIWGKGIVNADVANSLYAGINTDTGGLSHNSSRPETYRLVAELLEAGLDKAFVHEHLYQMNRLSRLRLLGYALLAKLKVTENYSLAIISLSKNELERFRFRDGDLEGLVNVPLTVRDVIVSVLVTERKDKVKLSFRSKGEVPVSEWTKRWFNGGGHLNAAGGQMELPLEEVVKLVEETAPVFFKEYAGIVKE